MPRATRQRSSAPPSYEPLDVDINTTTTAEFQEEVLRQIQRIPYGRVTSYGHIAKLAGRPRNARLVGNILKTLPRNRAIPFIAQAVNDQEADADGAPANAVQQVSNPAFVPWHRVLNSKGVISPRGSVAAVVRQADMLRNEGVTVNTGAEDVNEPPLALQHHQADAFGFAGVEGGRVSMRLYGWFPEE